ncbi:hypothetical protein TanjilG_24300 [Lupinus angustifolius]|uniref:Uncharacterized protein n=1 Tax=Lupinus angustifolius TaxID=3871 RepID=A0A1J7H233_LUPAN|nr:hypothetical protein TanjilG_24300 [Lupinus angustifolius]
MRRGTFKNYVPKHCKQKQHHKYLKEMKSRGKLKVFGDLLNFKIPTRKRSRMVLKNMTPMEMFQKQLLLLSKCDMEQNESYEEEVLLSNNGNNFIPNNEIGLGAILLKPNDAST